METWAGIVRVSHRGGRNGDTFHADKEQVAEIERYAGRHGARVVFMEPELSVSGGKPIEERPSLRAAIEGVEAGIFKGVVVAYLSRLSRSRSGIVIWDRVEAAGGHVHCAAEALDTSTPGGRWFRDVQLATAVREREEHVERHARRREKTVEAAVWRQRQLPRGYTFVGPASEDGRCRGLARRLVPGPDAEEVRHAFRLRAGGATLADLARMLRMTSTGAARLLGNRVYLGELRDGQYLNPVAHEPLIDVDTWEAAQRTVARPARGGTGAPALLAGLVRCAGCGHLMTRSGTGARPVYTCPRNHRGGDCPEPAAVTAAILDAYVEPIARGELARLSVTASDGDRVGRARARLLRAERELEAYVRAVSAADVGAETFGVGARERRAAVDTARAELHAELARRPVLPGDGTGADTWEGLDGRERNALLRALLEIIVVRRGGGRGSRTPLGDRVRVLAHGTSVPRLRRRGGEAGGIVPIPLPDLDDPGVLRVPGCEDALERPSRVDEMRLGHAVP